ncbi:hypothetical protein ACJX0J_007911, partial [Zea mays]
DSVALFDLMFFTLLLTVYGDNNSGQNYSLPELAKLAKGMGHNYYGEPAWPNDLLYIFPVVILGTIAGTSFPYFKYSQHYPIPIDKSLTLGLFSLGIFREIVTSKCQIAFFFSFYSN